MKPFISTAAGSDDEAKEETVLNGFHFETAKSPGCSAVL
jgi:hypothetical protein